MTDGLTCTVEKQFRTVNRLFIDWKKGMEINNNSTGMLNYIIYYILPYVTDVPISINYTILW